MKSDGLLEKIVIETTSNLIKSLVVVCLTAFGVILVTVYNPLTEILNTIVPKATLLLLLLSLILLLLLSVSYIVYLNKKLKNKLRQALGVYWDKEFNPYCPSCKNLLGNYAFYTAGTKMRPGFKCISCSDVVRMSDGENMFLALEEAKEIIKIKFNK